MVHQGNMLFCQDKSLHRYTSDIQVIQHLQGIHQYIIKRILFIGISYKILCLLSLECALRSVPPISTTLEIYCCPGFLPEHAQLSSSSIMRQFCVHNAVGAELLQGCCSCDCIRHQLHQLPCKLLSKRADSASGSGQAWWRHL